MIIWILDMFLENIEKEVFKFNGDYKLPLYCAILGTLLLRAVASHHMARTSMAVIHRYFVARNFCDGQGVAIV